MKKFLILFLSASLFVSCSDETSSDNTTNQTEDKEINLVGEWSVLEASENDEPLEALDASVMINFTEDLTWSMTYDGADIAGGEYETQAGQVFCYVADKQDPEGPQQYVWNYSGENGNLILDGYYFKGNDKVNMKVVAEKK